MARNRTSAPPAAAGRDGRRALVPAHAARLLRYVGGSGVATLCSAAAFALLYGVLGTSTTTATLLGWFAGAVPNYVLNRSWVWRVQGRPSLRREVGPYVAVVLLTLALAAGATRLTEVGLERAGATDAVVFTGVNIAFLGVYAVMALFRYAVLHQLFRRLPGGARTASTELADRSHEETP
ncbi:GtrA family protein [uncultured Pseudokineococcus sp.]|uniref:GtrA family protein n=1 Tax=uncultured Pseudokineococcus sp. TaxID=1642928 RepID=UPI0026053605|nr:GtrA family protein [uncultured Pseudokineococcus sp.]